jgi:hypothetical protein
MRDGMRQRKADQLEARRKEREAKYGRPAAHPQPRPAFTRNPDLPVGSVITMSDLDYPKTGQQAQGPAAREGARRQPASAVESTLAQVAESVDPGLRHLISEQNLDLAAAAARDRAADTMRDRRARRGARRYSAQQEAQIAEQDRIAVATAQREAISDFLSAQLFEPANEDEVDQMTAAILHLREAREFEARRQQGNYPAGSRADVASRMRQQR